MYSKVKTYFSRRQYEIDVNTSPKHEIDSGLKAGYYTAILSGKKDCSPWSISTGEQFASSFLILARRYFTYLPRLHKVSTGSYTH